LMCSNRARSSRCNSYNSPVACFALFALMAEAGPIKESL
jgi:hypothetical protein